VTLRERGVESRRDGPLDDVLWEWIALVERSVRMWSGEDVPWWYGERTSISTLAGAVWRAGGIAIEEFPSTKRETRERSARGRGDLSVRLGRRDYLFEAKLVWSLVGRRDPATALASSLDQARRDARRCRRPYGERRVAALFAVPYVSRVDSKSIDDVLEQWLARMPTIRPTRSAWVFPESSRRHAWKSHLYPGSALLLDEIDA
jgi:hypothetical protein